MQSAVWRTVSSSSIIPRGRAALGYTLQLPTNEQWLLSRSELLARIRSMLGGRGAEELVFGEVTTGAENDLEKATILARQMVCLYGMSESVGLTHCIQPAGAGLEEGNPYLTRDCSEQTAREIDQEVKGILHEGYQEAKALLQAHRRELDRVSVELLAHETLDAATFYRLIRKSEPQETAVPRPSMESKAL